MKKSKAPRTDDPLKPSATLLCKLGSIAVHADEFFGPKGHVFDRDALRSVLADHEVISWLAAMDVLAMVPKKR